MDYSKLTIKEIKNLWNEQILHMCMGIQDNEVVNGLAKEVKERGQLELFQEFQRDVIESYVK